MVCKVILQNVPLAELLADNIVCCNSLKLYTSEKPSIELIFLCNMTIKNVQNFPKTKLEEGDEIRIE